MDNARLEKINAVEAEYAEHRRPFKIPREAVRRRMLARAVRKAQEFASDILFNAGTFYINGKSPLMAFTLLNALKGQMVEVVARGPDSSLAARELSALFERRKAIRDDTA